MRVTLYGTRGSIPAPGPETMRYASRARMCGEWRCSGPGRRYWYPPTRCSTLRGNDSSRHPSDTPSHGSYSRVGFFPAALQPGGRGSPLGTGEQHSLAGGQAIALSLPTSISNTPSRSARCIVSSRPALQLRNWPVSHTDGAHLSPWADGSAKYPHRPKRNFPATVQLAA